MESERKRNSMKMQPRKVKIRINLKASGDHVEVSPDCRKLPQSARVVHCNLSIIQLDRFVHRLLTDSKGTIPTSYRYV